MASQFSFSFAYHTYLLVSHHANEFEKPTTFIIVVELCWNTHIRADKIEKRSFKKRKAETNQSQEKGRGSTNGSCKIQV